MMLECPVCLNSLLEPAGVNEKPCTNPACSPAQLCGNCVVRASKFPNTRKPPKTVNRTFNASSLLTDTSVTPCGHIFHSRCLKDWIKETVSGKPTCPNCRKPFTQARVVQVYLNGSVGNSPDPVPAHNNMTMTATTSSASTSGAPGCSSGSGPGSGAGVNSCNISSTTMPQIMGGGGASHQHHQSNPHQIIIIEPPPGLGNPEDLNPAIYDGGSLPDLKMIHNTLISDFNDLKIKYLELREEDDFRKGQLLSYEDENLQLKAELRKYQHQLHHNQHYQQGDRASSMYHMMSGIMTGRPSYQAFPPSPPGQYSTINVTTMNRSNAVGNVAANPIFCMSEMLPTPSPKRGAPEESTNPQSNGVDGPSASQSKRFRMEPSQPQPPQPQQYPMPTFRLAHVPTPPSIQFQQHQFSLPAQQGQSQVQSQYVSTPTVNQQ